MEPVKSKRELIKDSFLANIGKVIYRNRKRKGLKGAGLAVDAGITQSEISRYETGSVDISASKMAYIADALDFDLIEYTIDIDTKQRMSQIFKELVAAGIKRPSTAQHNDPKEKRKYPKYDRTDLDGNIIPTLPLQRTPKDDNLDPPTEADDRQFDDYLSKEETRDKACLLSMSYKLMVKDIDDTDSNLSDIKIAIRAITRYVASDHDRVMNDRLKEYLKRCKCLFQKQGEN